jgi:hypothetical protein
MKKQLLELQESRELLRLKLQRKFKFSEFDEESEKLSKKLSSLDGLFFRLCSKHGFELSKFGRLL